MNISKMAIEASELKTNRERLLFLCRHLDIPNLSGKELVAAQSFPYLTENIVLTDDYIMGAQNMMLVMTETFQLLGIDCIDLPLLAKCYLYHWWKANMESEFTETEI